MNNFGSPRKRRRILPVLSVILLLALLLAMIYLVLMRSQEPRFDDGFMSIYGDNPSGSSITPSTLSPAASPHITATSQVAAATTPNSSHIPAATNTTPTFTLPTPAPEANTPVEPNEFVKVAEQTKNSVVGISNRIRWLNNAGDLDDVEQANGSGVILSADGYIVTNAHVVDDANSLSVILYNGDELDALLIGTDTITDIAVLKVDASGLQPISVGNSDMVQAGDYAIAIGNPMGPSLFGTVTMGIVSAPRRVLDIEMRRVELMQTDAAINPGNSGGALINTRGELIGINSMKYSTTYTGESIERIGFAVPVNIVMSIAQELINHGSITRPVLGISPEVLNEYRARYLELPAGILVRYIYANSPAEKAGMEQYDVITHINGETILKYEDLTATLYSFDFGDTITVTVYRNGNKIDLQVHLDRYEFPEE